MHFRENLSYSRSSRNSAWAELRDATRCLRDGLRCVRSALALSRRAILRAETLTGDDGTEKVNSSVSFVDG
jgi:hypothetical protein